MGDRALCEALVHYGDSVLIEHWESK